MDGASGPWGKKSKGANQTEAPRPFLPSSTPDLWLWLPDLDLDLDLEEGRRMGITGSDRLGELGWREGKWDVRGREEG